MCGPSQSCWAGLSGTEARWPSVDWRKINSEVSSAFLYGRLVHGGKSALIILSGAAAVL